MIQDGFGFLPTAPFSPEAPWRDLPMIALDVESTGPDPKTARVLEVAAIQFARGKPLDRWARLADPGVEIPAEASAIHGITRQTIAGAPTPIDLGPELVARCAGRVSLTYNGLHYDLPVLERELGITRFARPAIDLLLWIRQIDRFVGGRGRHRLSFTAERWGVTMPATHRALADAEVTIRLLAKIQDRMPETIGEVVQMQEKMAADQESDRRAWLARQPKQDSAGPRESQSPAKDEVGSFGGVA